VRRIRTKKDGSKELSGCQSNGDHIVSKKNRNRQPTDIATPYKPKLDERAAADAVCARRIRTPRVKVSEAKGRTEISLDHPDPIYGHALLMSAFATGDISFCREILLQLAGASVQDGEVSERDLNFKISVVKGIQPRAHDDTCHSVFLLDHRPVHHGIGRLSSQRRQELGTAFLSALKSPSIEDFSGMDKLLS